jgi:hypothetical protein
MQSFTTHGPDHPFAVDGARYFLPGFNTDDFKTITGFASLPDEKKDEAFREFLATRAKRRWLSVFRRSAYNTVSLFSDQQLADLLRGWMNMPEAVPGESKSSPE